MGKVLNSIWFVIRTRLFDFGKRTMAYFELGDFVWYLRSLKLLLTSPCPCVSTGRYKKPNVAFAIPRGIIGCTYPATNAQQKHIGRRLGVCPCLFFFCLLMHSTVYLLNAKAMGFYIITRAVFLYREEEKETENSAIAPHTRWGLVSLLLRIFVDLAADLSPTELSSKFCLMLKRGDLHHILFDLTLAHGNEKDKSGDLELPPENDDACTQPDFRCLGMNLAKQAQKLYAHSQRLTLGLLLQVIHLVAVMVANKLI